MFDAKYLEAIGAAIAYDTVYGTDDQPKPNIGEVLRRGLARLIRLEEVAQPEASANIPAEPEALKWA